MILNDIQKIDFYKGLKQTSTIITSIDTEHLDLKGIENRIQQTIGVLNLLEKLNFKENSFRQMMIKTLKELYQRKRDHLYGYEEKHNLLDELVECG